MPARSAAMIEGSTCSIHYIARNCGVASYGKRRLLEYVSDLVASFGLPRPFPTHVKGLGTVDEVRETSRWSIEAVDDWLNDRLPPAGAVALDRRRAALDADLMDQRAAGLGLRLVEGGRH